MAPKAGQCPEENINGMGIPLFRSLDAENPDPRASPLLFSEAPSDLSTPSKTDLYLLVYHYFHELVVACLIRIWARAVGRVQVSVVLEEMYEAEAPSRREFLLSSAAAIDTILGVKRRLLGEGDPNSG